MRPTVPSPTEAPLKGAPQGGLSLSPDRYPKVDRDVSVIDELHGFQIADPYRWLEDPDSAATKEWVEAQNLVTSEVLEQCKSREPFKELMTQLYDYPKFGTPFKRGGRWYYYYNSGLQPQHALYSVPGLDTPHEQAVLVLDPNLLSEDGTVSLGQAKFSESGRLMAYTLASGGSDWKEVHVLEIGDDGAPSKRTDVVRHVKFSSLAWTHDDCGFFYSRFVAPDGVEDLGTETAAAENQQLRYHALGTDPETDPVVFAMPEHPQWMCSADVTDDGKFLLLYVSEGCKPANRLFLVDLEQLARADGAAAGPDFARYDFFAGAEKLPVNKFIDNFDASYHYVANDGYQFVLYTNRDAPRYRIVTANVTAEAAVLEDLVPEDPKHVMDGAHALKGDVLVVTWLKDVKTAIEVRRLSDGQVVKELPMPFLGSLRGFAGDRKSTEAYFSLQGFTEPGSIYRLDAGNLEEEGPELFRRAELKYEFDPEQFVTQQVFVPSKDGVKVPMFVVHRKDIVLDGSNPTLLYGYGGFNISLEPGFSVTRLCWLLGFGGVYAQANLRGGGEYGIDWRRDGSLESKQNVFNDFQSCAEHLIASGFCTPEKLAIQGGSNGGLLVAACANQRPDLYGCVLAQVGVMDMLRFHKFTIGHAWMSDFGNPDDEQDFQYLRSYSPLHNVRPPENGRGQHPATLLLTADHDDRVVPLHSFKLVSQLQYQLASAQDSPQRNPLVIRVEVKAGHGAGKPTKKIIEEAADMMGFAAAALSTSWSLP